MSTSRVLAAASSVETIAPKFATDTGRLVECVAPVETPFEQRLRDLQIGRLLFGVSYRTSPTTTLNWNVEVGATDDAADVRTTLRIPFTFNAYDVKAMLEKKSGRSMYQA